LIERTSVRPSVAISVSAIGERLLEQPAGISRNTTGIAGSTSAHHLEQRADSVPNDENQREVLAADGLSARFQ